MRYRLALDVGTASLGLVAFSLDDQIKPISLEYSALHIFDEPLDPSKSGGIGTPKKAKRRLARQQRRLIDRRARRLRRVAHLAPLIGIDPGKNQADSGQTIHALRAASIQERVELPQLLNIFLKMAKRRGYGGGFKSRKEDESAGEVESGIKNLEKELNQYGFKTLGQLLNHRFGDPHHAGRGPRLSLKLKNIDLYAHRSMIEHEFDLIWSQQAQHHPILNEEALSYTINGVIEKQPIKEHFKQAIFNQRPLKSVAGMVGQCSLEPTLPRAPVAQVSAQTFRIEKQLADLRWGMGRSQKPLTSQQRDHIRSLLLDTKQLNTDGEITFKKIYDSLEKAGLRQEFPSQFNTDRFSREALIGDRTSKTFEKLGLLQKWRELDASTQIRVINLIANLGSSEFIYNENWHLLIKPKPHERVVGFINYWANNHDFGRLSQLGFDGGRSAYCIKALTKLSEKMREAETCDEYHAIQSLYKPMGETDNKNTKLTIPAGTGNVVVDQALRVITKAVNECMNTLKNPPTQIVIELTRDMGLGIKAREKIEKTINDNRRARNYAKNKIEESAEGYTATNNDIFRYLLAQEQDFHCPYCLNQLQVNEVLDGNKSNVDHILPKSLTQIRRKRSHLVIAHRSCNSAKGDDVPLVAFKAHRDRIDAILSCANILRKKKFFKKANYLLAESYESEKLTDQTLADFSDRQFVETSWIAKFTAQWMREICKDVSVSRGELTAQLRRSWKLETVVPQVRFETKVKPKNDNSDNHLPVLDDDQPPKIITKEEFDRYRACWENHHGPSIEKTDRRIDKRIDHRHHLIDALVIGLTDRSLFMSMARTYKDRMEQKSKGQHGVRVWETPAPPIKDIRKIALKLIQETKIKHRADRYATGSFFEDFAYAKVYADDGTSRLARSYDLIGLTDGKFSLEKARKGISDIVSPTTRKIVSDEFEARIDRGDTVESALNKPIEDKRYGTLIRQVQIFHRTGKGFVNGENAIPVRFNGRSFAKERKGEKYLLSDGYAYIALIKNETGQIVDAHSVRTVDAHIFDEKNVVKKIFKKDTVIDTVGERYLVHQILADGTIIAALLTESRTVKQLDASSGKKKFGKNSVMKLKFEK